MVCISGVSGISGSGSGSGLGSGLGKLKRTFLIGLGVLVLIGLFGVFVLIVLFGVLVIIVLFWVIVTGMRWSKSLGILSSSAINGCTECSGDCSCVA